MSELRNAVAHQPAVVPVPGDVARALSDVVGPLLADRDVTEVQSVEGGLVEVLRRGRRERLETVLEGPLFEILREHGAGAGVVSFLTGEGHALDACALTDGRVAFSLQKAPPTEVSLKNLLEEGVLPEGVPDELVAAVLQGSGVLFLGPSRTARQRAAVAVGRALTGRLRLGVLASPGIAGALPPPLAASFAERVQRSVRLGVDAVLGLEVSIEECAWLVGHPPAVPFIGSVRASSMAALTASLAGAAVEALAGLTAVLGHGPDGRPRLIELHGAVPDAGVGTASSASGPPRPPPAPSRPPSSAFAPVMHAPSLPALESPPVEWGGTQTAEDPGWELSSLSSLSSLPPGPTPSPGSFDAALKAAAQRPVFSPQPPPAHPQTRSLRGTGGLTFEPPGGEAGADEAPAEEGDES